MLPKSKIKGRSTSTTVFVASLLLSMVLMGSSYFLLSQDAHGYVANNLHTSLHIRTTFLIEFLADKEEKVEIASSAKQFSDFLGLSLKEINLEITNSLRAELENINGKDVGEERNFAEILLANDEGIVLVSTEKVREGNEISNSQQYTSDQLNKENTILIPEYDELLLKDFFTIITPILDEDNKVLGFLAAKVLLNQVNEILLEESDVWETRETYLVNNKRLLLTPSKFLRGQNKGVLTQQVDTKGTEHCFSEHKDHETTINFENYRGEEVIGTHDYISEYNWCVLTEVSYDEALRTNLTNFVLTNMIISLLVIISLTLAAFLLDEHSRRTFRGE